MCESCKNSVDEITKALHPDGKEGDSRLVSKMETYFVGDLKSDSIHIYQKRSEIAIRGGDDPSMGEETVKYFDVIIPASEIMDFTEEMLEIASSIMADRIRRNIAERGEN